ncbi:carboxypeptidase-like regulatory domain-containing protein [Roseivirga sp. E12]|uniref:TonB-dependent receptor n=1 Tax=Roseivirga sp. E12 TaxID=2819237 RepID=UPI001ABCBD6E|nr:carboxypeptidase-like regulatory domain-containing protein [Roseivirga sp. E12]MBO3697191.1 carboxypeptidase-like regulatory domain-containing protein [Roseivirga sp. E12]
MNINTTQQIKNWYFLVSKASKRIALLLCLLILPLTVQAQSDGQYTASNRSLKQVLNDLEKQFSIYFSYNPDEVREERISISGNYTGLSSLLGLIIGQTSLELEQIKDEFYVVKRPESKYLDIQVIDDETGGPLPYATFRLLGTSLGQVAGMDGAIKLVLPNPKSAVLEVSYLGFQTTTVNVESINTNDRFVINLKPTPIELTDFEVKEYINVGIGSDPKANSFRILPQQMEILPGLSERDVLLSAQIISGLTSNDESASGINIRGSAPDNTLLYWNDVPVYHSAHYFGNVSSFIPSSTGSLDIYKNYIPVRYGGATAGLISIASRNQIDGETRAEASVNMTHADVYAKLPFKRDLGSFMVALRRSYNDALPTWTYNSYSTKLFGSETRDGQGLYQVTDNVADFENNLSFYDINLKWDYQPNSRSLFTASFVNSSSRFSYQEDDDLEDVNIQQNHEIKSYGGNFGYSYRINDKNSLKSSLSYSNYDMSYAFSNLRDDVSEDDNDESTRSNAIRNLELRLSNSWRINDSNILEYGYQLNHFNIDNVISETEFFEEDAVTDINSNGLVNGLFFDLNHRPNDKLEAIVSGRVTHVGTLGEAYFSPQAKLNYSLKPNLILKSSVGLYHQYLSTIQESDFTLSNAVERHWLLSDLNEDEDEIATVPIIFNRQATLGFIYNEKSWLIDLDLYLKDIDGILAINQGFGFESDQAFEPGFELIQGIDLTIRKRWKYLRAWMSYNFQDSKVELNSIFDNPFPSSFNIKHQLRLSTTYNWKNWEFSLGYIFKTGLPFTPTPTLTTTTDSDDDDDDDDDPDTGSDDIIYDLEYVSPNTQRLPNYHRIDLSVWHKFGSDNSRIKGEVGLSIINLLNRKNTFNRSYSVDFDRNNQISVLERTKFFLGFTPNISFRIWF